VEKAAAFFCTKTSFEVICKPGMNGKAVRLVFTAVMDVTTVRKTADFGKDSLHTRPLIFLPNQHLTGELVHIKNVSFCPSLN
jgi:hypothetical protein